MGNHVSAVNLGNAVNVLLGSGAISVPDQFTRQAFMIDIAAVICKHVGGELVPSGRMFDADDKGVIIEPESMPSSSRKGFWNDFVTPSSSSANPPPILAELALQTTKRDIFGDLLNAGNVHINGKSAVRVAYRGDLVAQERINDAPRSTIIDQHLFEVRPDLLKACRAMCKDFAVEKWAGRFLEEFASEYATAHEHDTTIILHLLGTHDREAKLTLDLLWNATPAGPGEWRVGVHVISIVD